MSRQEIEANEQRYADAFNRKDAAGVAALYTESGRLMGSGGSILEGRAAVEKSYSEFLKDDWTISLKLLELYEAPELCAAMGEYEMGGSAAGSKSAIGRFIEIWVRQPDGSWLIADEVFNS